MNTKRDAQLMLLVAVFAAPLMLGAQARPGRIVAPSTPPPEALQADTLQVPGTHRVRNTRESLIERLRAIPSLNAITAPDTPPRDVDEAEQQVAPAEHARPTVRSLIEKIRTLPGGAQLLQDARRRGARVSARGLPLFGSFGGLIGDSTVAIDQSVDAIDEVQSAFSVTLTPSASSQTNPSAALSGWGALVGAAWTNTAYWYLCNCARPPIGSTFTKPYARFQVTVPKAGWYIVNFDAAPGNKVTLWRWSGTAYVTVSTFDYTGTAGVQSYPALLELGAGTHYFYLVANVGGLMIYEANAFSL